MQLPISLGNQGFASLRENHCFYIDKTDFIREWWEEQDVVTLITRLAVLENIKFKYDGMLLFYSIQRPLGSI